MSGAGGHLAMFLITFLLFNLKCAQFINEGEESWESRGRRSERDEGEKEETDDHTVTVPNLS